MSNTHLTSLALLLPVSLALCACGSDDADPTPQPVKFASFNAGLATNFVPYSPERVSKVTAAVKALDADVLCMQEVWSDADADAVIEGVASTFPHVLRVKTEDDPGAASLPVACTEGEVGELKACVEKNCSADPNDPCSEAPSLTECGLSMCGTLLPESKACYDCIAANIGLGAEGIFATCAKKGGGQFAFKGRNGLILLSRVPLTDTGHTVLKSSTNRRVLLKAQASFDGSKVHLYCTHLTAGLANIQYNGDFGSWEAEQAQQIDAIIAMIDKEAGEEAVVLIGDTNCGPTTATVDGEMEANYKKFTDAGFKSPYVEAPGALCTWCNDNTLHGAADDKKTKGTTIDHVLMKNLDDAVAKARTARIIDGKVEIEVACKKKQVHVSDHYGLTVELDPGF